MAKKFNIHDWQSRHIFEQNDFIPDLEDDDLKRSKIQQMMDKEKGGKEGPPYISAAQLFDNIIKGLETSGPYQDDIMFSKERALEIMEMIIDIEESEISPEAALAQAMEKEDELNENEENIPKLSDQEKDNLHDMVIEFARKLTDLRGGNYLGDRLLAALQHVTLEIENLEPMIYDDEDGDGIPDVIDGQEEYSKIEKAWDNLDRSEQKSIIDDVLSGEARPDEYEKSFDQLSDENEEFESAIKNYLGLDEQNMTNTGVSFTAGDGEGYATPSAFAKPGQWKRKNEKYEE